jgi:hypothetical protein
MPTNEAVWTYMQCLIRSSYTHIVLAADLSGDASEKTISDVRQLCKARRVEIIINT